MLRAVPSIIRIAASSSAAFKSCILELAISRTCSLVTVATLVLLGSPEPFYASCFLSSTGAGGVFVINVK